jgi:hypothetical protein
MKGPIVYNLRVVSSLLELLSIDEETDVWEVN